MLGLSQSVLSKWQSGARQPSLSSALSAGDFFGVPADRLARADFSDLLANELAEPERYAEVEAEIRRRRSTLRELGDAKMLEQGAERGHRYAQSRRRATGEAWPQE